MRILLVGGHQKTNFLTKSLVAKRHDVTVINDDPDWCKLLSNTYNVCCVYGDGTKPYILADAEAGRMDAVIALSNVDSSNLVVCELAKKQFGVPNTIAVVNDPKNVHIFKKLGVSKCISATQMITEIIEHEAVFENLKNYFPLENGRLAVSEVLLSGSSPACGRKIWQLDLPQDSIIGCIVRGEQTIIPKGNTLMEAGDKVVILSTAAAIDDTAKQLLGR